MVQTTAHGLRVNREGLGDPRPVAPLEQPLAERLDEHRTLVLGQRVELSEVLAPQGPHGDRVGHADELEQGVVDEGRPRVGDGPKGAEPLPHREGVGKLGDRHGRPDDAVDVGHERAKGGGQCVRSDRQPEDGLGVEVLGSEQDRSVDLRLGQGAAMRMES
mgnify:CR=1 FL=1